MPSGCTTACISFWESLIFQQLTALIETAGLAADGLGHGQNLAELSAITTKKKGKKKFRPSSRDSNSGP